MGILCHLASITVHFLWNRVTMLQGLVTPLLLRSYAGLMCPLLWQIYIPLEGASQDKTVVDFQTASLDLKVHDVNGKSYHFCIQKLSKEIVPTASRVIVKPKRIILSLKKADSRNWLDLVKREEKV